MSGEKAALLGSSRLPAMADLSLEDKSGLLERDPSTLTSFDEKIKTPPTPSEPVLGDGGRKKGLTLVLVLSVVASVLGSSTQFGFNTGVINNPKAAILEDFNRGKYSFSELEWTIAVSIFAIGGLAGALPAGFLADYVGRKYTMLLNNIVVVVGVALQSAAVHPIMFILGRFILGINAGLNTVLVPLYLSEIAPTNLRGSLGVCHQMAIVSTIFISQILGLNFLFGRPEWYGWRLLFALCLFFSLLQVLLLPWLPESPKFLFLKRRKEEDAIKALRRLRGNANIEDEIQLMKEELEEMQRPKEKVNLMQFFVVPHLRLALVISVVLHLSQQLSGINGIFYYSTDIFIAAGISHPDIATVFTVGLVLVIVTTITVFLIELLGRRTLMLYGLGGMAVFFTFLTSMFCFLDGFYGNLEATPTVTVPGILLVMSSLGITSLFALGPGGIPWLMVGELFMQEARPVAITIATIVNWAANFVVGLGFPYVLKYMYPYGTIIFTISCSLLWICLYLYLPETKGRTVEDITSLLKDITGDKKKDNRKVE